MARNPKGHLVEKEFLTLPVWDQLDATTAEAVARAVERCLPEPWRFDRLAWHEMGDQRRHVAFFDWSGTSFALIPGGDIRLGWDAQSGYTPTDGMLADWDATASEYGLPSLHEYIAAHTSRPRVVNLGPVLAEVEGRQGFGNEADPGDRTAMLGDVFQMPSVDQWEYLSAAGSRTLWRWGNECPSNGYPCDHQPGRNRANRTFGFDLHRRPNAFGLLFPSDGYDAEGVVGSDGAVVARSGDGGCLTCGGAGFTAGWLLLASPAVVETMSTGEYFERVRRLYPLPPEILD